MKSIQVQGKQITGKNFGELKAKIKAMGLKGKEFGQAMSAANNAFPKKDAGSSKRQPGKDKPPRGYPGSQKMQVTITRLEDNGIKLQILTGPSKAILAEVRSNKNARNLVHAEIQTHVVGTDAQATVVLLEGNVDRAKVGNAAKDMLKPYVNQPGFSRLSGVKAIQVFNKRGYAPIGENLDKENVRRFVQALVAATYDGAALRGAKMGDEIISTNVFLATDAKVRQMAWWPANQPNQYVVVGISTLEGSPSVSYLGTLGLFGITPTGQAFIAPFEEAIKAAAVAGIEGKVAKMPWQKISIPLDSKMSNGPYEASVASSLKNEQGEIKGYSLFITGAGYLAVVELISSKTGELTAKVKETVAFQSDMALMGFANDGATAVLANLNGGRDLFGFMPTASLGFKAENLPAGIIAAQKLRAERIAAKQAEQRQ